MNGVSLEVRFWAKVNKTDGCWEWTGSCSPGGYGQIHLDGRLRAAHRVSWELSHGPIPEGKQACHHCDNKRCVRPEHLFIGTQSDNVRDMFSKRRTPNWKLRQRDVDEIRRMSAAGVPTSEIAATFSIHQAHARKVARGAAGNHVPKL